MFSVFCFQLTVVCFQLSVVSCLLSVVSGEWWGSLLSVDSCLLSVCGEWLVSIVVSGES